MRIFETVLRMSASASFAIAVVLLLRLVLKRMPKGFTWMLWLAVLARLWCPVFPTVSLGVSVPVVEPAALIEQLRPGTAAPVPNLPQEQTDAQTVTPAKSTADPVDLLPLVWASGAAVMALWGVASDLRLRKHLQTAVCREDGVYLVDGIDTPFVRGLLTPRIYLPSDLDGAGERYILLHERQHIRSFDPAAKLLFFGALCVHWFNPLVWLACALAERDMELRCDEGVFRNLKQDERMDYASVLVACATQRRRLMPLAFGEGDTKRRVKNVLTYRKPKWWAFALAAILCITATGCMLTDPPEVSDPAQFEMPGLKWGMSPDEVLSALEKTTADIVHEEESREETTDMEPWRYVMILSGVEAFGQETTAAMFAFVDDTDTGDSYLLSEIKLCYPDGYDGSEKADTAALEAELTRIYGAPKETAHWDLETKKDMEVTPEQPANLFTWESAVTGWDCLTQEQQEGLCADYEASRTEDSLSMEWYLERWKVPAFRMTFQPYWHRVLALGGHGLPEESRSWGLSNICISLDAITYFGFQHSAVVILGTE